MATPLDKRDVIREIENYLREELNEAKDPAEQTRLTRLIDQYRFMPRREYGDEDVVIPSALVELDLGGTHAHYFVAPAGGGLITNVAGKPVQVITPQSPLGEVLLGRRVGDRVRVGIRGSHREYRIVSIR